MSVKRSARDRTKKPKKGEVDEAGSLVREAVAGFREVLGSNHEKTLDAIDMLAGYFLVVRRDCAAAEPLLRECLLGFDRLYGPEHENTRNAYMKLVLCLRERGRK